MSRNTLYTWEIEDAFAAIYDAQKNYFTAQELKTRLPDVYEAKLLSFVDAQVHAGVWFVLPNGKISDETEG